MISFEFANKQDIECIHNIAKKTWFETYRTIISAKQMDFMFEKMYAISALAHQIEVEKNVFIIAYSSNEPVGFISFKKDTNEPILKIPKLYIVPNMQGKGIGEMLINKVVAYGKQNNFNFIELNVNRNNPAIGFYLKQGFSIKETIDIPYFEFVLNDFIMVKVI